jgi:hypothetical protein
LSLEAVTIFLPLEATPNILAPWPFTSFSANTVSQTALPLNQYKKTVTFNCSIERAGNNLFCVWSKEARIDSTGMSNQCSKLASIGHIPNKNKIIKRSFSLKK